MATAGPAVIKRASATPDELLPCPRCQGEGATGPLRTICMLCSGHGTVPQIDAGDYVRDLIVPCTECGGSGKLGEAKCSMCDSSGVISAETAESLSDMDLEFQGVAKAGRYLALLGVGCAVAVAGVLWKIL